MFISLSKKLNSDTMRKFIFTFNMLSSLLRDPDDIFWTNDEVPPDVGTWVTHEIPEDHFIIGFGCNTKVDWPLVNLSIILGTNSSGVAEIAKVLYFRTGQMYPTDEWR